MNYALIEEETVRNIIVLNPSNAGEFPQAVAVQGLGVQIGDTYQDGTFYRDGQALPILPEEVEDLGEVIDILTGEEG